MKEYMRVDSIESLEDAISRVKKAQKKLLFLFKIQPFIYWLFCFIVIKFI